VASVAEGVLRIQRAGVNCHLLIAPDGLTLVDTGLPGMWRTVVHALDSIGATPDDVTAIVHTHGHFDHVGLSERFRTEHGARSHIHAADRALAELHRRGFSDRDLSVVYRGAKARPHVSADDTEAGKGLLAGATIGGVQLSAAQWLETGVAVWLGLIPFAVLGLVIGFAGTVDTVQPISMITYLGLSILGGLWFPVDQFPTFLQDVAKVTPSYWLGELGRTVLAGQGVPMTAVAVLAAWTVVLSLVAIWSYRRSGAKV
jgi:hypothetical protein